MSGSVWRSLAKASLLPLFGFLLHPSALGKDLRIPQDFETLSAAIGAASAGDRVLVTNRGLFQETLRVDRDLTLTSEPPGATIDQATTSTLVVTSGATHVAINGFTLRNAAWSGVLVDVGDNNPFSLELTGTKLIANRGLGVVFHSGRDLNFTADRCAFSGNAEGGFHSFRPIAITMRECEVQDNKDTGVCVAVSENVASVPPPVVTCTVSDCKIDRNDGHGVNLTGLATINATLSRCQITKNIHGVWIDPGEGYTGKILIEDTLCADGREVGISVMNPAQWTLRRCQIRNNYRQGLRSSLPEERRADPSHPSSLTLEDCEFTSNGYSGVELGGYVSEAMTMSRCRLTGNEHGLLTCPAHGYKAEVTVRDCALNGNLNYGITCNHMNDLELTSCTVSHNRKHGIAVQCDLPGAPENEPAGSISLTGCAIQANAWSGIEQTGDTNIAWNLVQDRIERNDNGIVVNPRPPFGAQLTISRCTLQGNNNRSVALGDRYALAFRDGAEWRGVLSDSCCAIFDGTPLGEANGKSGVTLGPGGAWFDYWTSPGNGKPAAPLTAIDAASLWPGFPSRPPLASLAGPALALRRCALMTNLLDQAEAWQSAGQSQKASGLLGLAQSIQRRFSPASPGGWALPLSARQRLDQVAAEVSQRQASVAAPYDVLMDRLACMPELPEVKLETPVAKLHDEVVQLKLNQLAGQLRECNAADLMANLIGGWHGFMTAYLAPPERLAAVQWLDGQLASAKDSTTSASLVFHKQWQAMYQELNSPAGEEKHLLWISGRCPKTGDAQQALERLTELYLDFWKAPEKAIQAQRQIQTAYAGSEREFQARLRIAKILEEQKNHEMAIVELSQLLEKLPPQLDPNPARTLLGLAYLGMNSTDEARNQFAKVINSDEGKNREKCLYLMAYSYIVDQRFPEAIKPLTDLKSLYPDGPYTPKAEGYLTKIKSFQQ